MKFTTDGKEFKTAIDKAMALKQGKKLDCMNVIKVTANAGGVTVFAYVATNAVKIKLDADITEQGIVYVRMDDIKRIYSLDGIITFEAADNTITLKNDKYKRSVTAVDYEVNDELQTDNAVKVLEFSTKELVKILDDLSAFVDPKQPREMCAGFYFDGKEQNIVALDGYRMGIKSISKSVVNDNFGATVRADCCKHLKKIAKGKNNNDIGIYFDERYAIFKGADFEYYAVLFKGEFINYLNLIPKRAESVMIDSAEIIDIAKEYNQALKGHDPKTNPCYFVQKDNELYVSICNAGLKMANVIESADFGTSDNNVLFAVNASYLKDCVKIFNNDIELSFAGKTAVVTFKNDEYTVFLCPIRVIDEQSVVDYINSL